MAEEDAVVNSFIAQHGVIHSAIDMHGIKGECVTSDELIARSGVSSEEFAFHLRLMEIDNYVATALKDTYCTRDAIRILSKKIVSGLE